MKHAKQSLHFAKCSKCSKSIQPGEPRYIIGQANKCIKCFKVK